MHTHRTRFLLEKSDRLFDTESGSAEHDLKDEFSELSPEFLEWVLKPD